MPEGFNAIDDFKASEEQPSSEDSSSPKTEDVNFSAEEEILNDI